MFGGDTGPYREDSPTDPISVYGRTRVAAEQLVLARPNTLVVRAGPVDRTVVDRPHRSPRLAARSPSPRAADDGRRRRGALGGVGRGCRAPRLGARALRRHRDPAHRRDARRVAARARDATSTSGSRSARRSSSSTARERRAPHLGRVELATRYTDALAAPLPSVVPSSTFQVRRATNKPNAAAVKNMIRL